MRNRTASRSLDIQQVGYHEEGVVAVDEDAGLEVAQSLPVVEEVGQLHMPPMQQLNWAEQIQLSRIHTWRVKRLEDHHQYQG